LVRSSDGLDWTEVGPVPPSSAPIRDPDGRRFLAVTREPHDGDVAAPVLWSSSDGATWSELARGEPSAVTYGSVVAAGSGQVGWVVDAGDRTDEGAWNWVAISTDGGASWWVSAGWPDQVLEDGKSIAISWAATVIAGGPWDATGIWTQPRSDDRAAPDEERR
jgi:hypothetical protein